MQDRINTPVVRVREIHLHSCSSGCSDSHIHNQVPLETPGSGRSVGSSFGSGWGSGSGSACFFCTDHTRGCAGCSSRWRVEGQPDTLVCVYLKHSVPPENLLCSTRHCLKTQRNCLLQCTHTHTHTVNKK